MKKFNRKKYKERLEREKEKYKKRKGLKIARGFKKSPEYKRVKAAERQARYRFKKRKRKKIGEETLRAFEGESPEGLKVLEVNDPELFWTSLSYGTGKTRLINQVYEDYRQSQSKPVVAVINDFKGETSSYEEPWAFDRAVQQLFAEAESIRDQTGDTGLAVRFSVSEDNDNLYLTIDTGF